MQELVWLVYDSIQFYAHICLFIFDLNNTKSCKSIFTKPPIL